MFATLTVCIDGSSEVRLALEPVRSLYFILYIWSQELPNKRCKVLPFTLWKQTLLPQIEAIRDTELRYKLGLTLATSADINTTISLQILLPGQ